VTLRFTVLGCGSSPGVPRIDGDWGQCDPADPRNRRTRCSLLVERAGEGGENGGRTTVVIDTSPDFRAQMLAARVKRIDAVVYTHPHADHIHGIDDLRQYALLQRQRIPTYANAETNTRLMSGFAYCFVQPAGSIYPPILEANEIKPGQSFAIAGPGGEIRFLPILQTHGPAQSLGFRIGADPDALSGGLAYCPDISGVPQASVGLLENLDVWIVDALQYRVHLSHFALSQALEWIERLKPRRAVLTHMHTPLNYATVDAETPPHVTPAFDGMTIELPA
jgi:phosphoribosyl 1,2-cyclic phosphate phosphodiesterase